jgi:hypothetical protein
MTETELQLLCEREHERKRAAHYKELLLGLLALVLIAIIIYYFPSALATDPY